MAQEDIYSILDETYYDESRLPPPESGDGEGEKDSWDWGEILVDNVAYMIDERNNTTARCPVTRTASDGVKEDMLQVTFCLAPPPHISYFCISYNSKEPTRFLSEPRIMAMEGNLALIVLNHCTLLNEPSNYTYFVYRAPILGHDSPSLRRLTHPGDDVFLDLDGCYLAHCEPGILRYRTSSGRTDPFTPPTPTLTHNPAPALVRRHKSTSIPYTNIDDYDAYKIAKLSVRWRSGTRQYDLCTYDSMADAWTRKPTSFLQPHDFPPEHSCDRVITIGGKMGWVDLCRGILLCDVHIPAGQEESPSPRLLRCIPLPQPSQPDSGLPIHGCASSFRDITVVQGLIKFVDLQIHASPGSLIPSGWTAVTWIMAPDDLEFRKDAVLHSHDIIDPLQSSLFVAHPRLSSHDDDVLYVMTKASLDHRASHVIAVNMKTKKIERAAKFTTQREASMYFAYMRSTISNYLSPDPKGNTKQRGSMLQGSYRKKQPVINLSKDLPPMGDDGDTMDME